MTGDSFTDAELAAYVSETLAVERSVAVETALRNSAELRQRVATLVSESDQQPRSVGEIWRRRQVSCPSRSTWMAYLADDVRGGLRDYLDFHLTQIGCRICAANVADLRRTSDASAPVRVRKIFATSLGQLDQAAREMTRRLDQSAP